MIPDQETSAVSGIEIEFRSLKASFNKFMPVIEDYADPAFPGRIDILALIWGKQRTDVLYTYTFDKGKCTNLGTNPENQFNLLETDRIQY